jgi:hypothetical protein
MEEMRNMYTVLVRCLKGTDHLEKYKWDYMRIALNETGYKGVDWAQLV